jgi:hypothetical protein
MKYTEDIHALRRGFTHVRGCTLTTAASFTTEEGRSVGLSSAKGLAYFSRAAPSPSAHEASITLFASQLQHATLLQPPRCHVSGPSCAWIPVRCASHVLCIIAFSRKLTARLRLRICLIQALFNSPSPLLTRVSHSRCCYSLQVWPHIPDHEVLLDAVRPIGHALPFVPWMLKRQRDRTAVAALLKITSPSLHASYLRSPHGDMASVDLL